jgi:FkbM family methyltransferase
MACHGIGINNHESQHLSGESHLINKVLPQLIKNDQPVLLDVGANIGLYSERLMESFPNAQLYCFEPQKDNFKKLTDRVQGGKANLYNIGLGSVRTSMCLYDRGDSQGSSHASMHKAVISEIHKQQVVEYNVQVDTLESFCENEGINHIDFLKVDTEGHDYEVLKGAESLIEKNSIDLIHFEFNSMNVISKVFFRDFRILLKNYKFYRLLPDGIVGIDDSILYTELYGFQNILAINNSMNNVL